MSSPNVMMSPARFMAAMVSPRFSRSPRFLIEPAREQAALGIGHARLVPERHVLQHDRAVADRLDAGADALRRIEPDAVWRGPEDVVGRRPRVAGDTPAIDDVLHGGEGDRIAPPRGCPGPRRRGEIDHRGP